MTRHYEHYEHLILLNGVPDVFVQAQTTRFGLTRETLAAESSVLATLLENTPSDNGPPVTNLDEDPGKLQSFLRILCDNGALSGFLCTSGTGFRLGELAVLLEMSTKYGANQIRVHTIALLSTTFPTSLATFPQQRTYLGMFSTEAEYKQDRFETLPSINIFEVFLVLSAAQKANAGALVLSVLYRCATSLSPDEITSPAKDPEGHGTVCLSPQDQRTCLFGRQRCLDHIVQFMTFCIEGQLAQGCWDKECIRQKLKEFNHLRMIKNPDLLAFQWDAHDTWNGSADGCYKRAMTEWNRARLLFWNRLPEFFGMAPWWILRDQILNDLHDSANLFPSVQLDTIPGEIVASILRTLAVSHPSAARSVCLISRDINTIGTDELYRTLTLRNADNGASPFWNLSALLNQKQLPIRNLDLLGLAFCGNSSSRYYFNVPDVSAAMWNFLDQGTLRNPADFEPPIRFDHLPPSEQQQHTYNNNVYLPVHGSGLPCRSLRARI
ncbi:hypothetical protein B0H14DRAFT_3866182 [Mycena olivaceomarginata]|nr:hypothetical protein B0H14DRAFT_3866182 [Mycena olivaceomarginata]